jgi:EH_Signature domain
MDLDQVLSALHVRRSGLKELEDHLRAMRWHVDPSRLPQPPSTRPRAERSRWAAPASLTPAEVLSHWANEGSPWLQATDLRDRRAILAALADLSAGQQLARDPSFFAALAPLVNERQQARAAALLAAQHYPPALPLRDALAAAVSGPPWWSMMRNPAALASVLAEHIAERGWPAVRDDWKLPAGLAASDWAEAIVKHVPDLDLDGYLRLLRFADGGEDKRAPVPLRSCHLPIVRRIVAQTPTSKRLQVAALLRQRVGDVFGVVDEARWRHLEEERRILRGWVANKVLDVLFKHVVPVGMGHDQTQPRQHFWSGYTDGVERLWLLLDRRLRARVEHDEVKRLLADVGDMIEVRQLDGSTEQAVVWMHLRNDAGRVVTVIEGNANTSCRMSPLEVFPPAHGPIWYSGQIVHARGFEAFTHNHPASSWQSKFGLALYRLGVRRTGRSAR